MTGAPFGRTDDEMMVRFGEAPIIEDKEVGGKSAACVFTFLLKEVRQKYT